MPRYKDSDGNEIGFGEAMKFQLRDSAGFKQAQTGGLTFRERLERDGVVRPKADRPFRLNHTLTVKDGQIIHGRHRHPLAGAHATVDTAGAIDKRVTATRLILTGPFAFGLRKKKDARELFLLIEGDGFGFVVDLDPKKQKDAREFAAKLNAAAGRAAPPNVGDAPSTTTNWLTGARATEGAPPAKSDPSIPDQIRQLGELRDQGLVTLEEFETKKAELLSRL